MSSVFNTPGPKPGPDDTIRQHKMMAMGRNMPMPERKVKTFQSEGKSGCGYSPGLTSSKSKRKGN